jgi:glycosyltransferase involved in cell wall biosynthesis
LHGTTTPYFVFPHGMLDPWFKQTYPLKHLKKWLYWPWAEYRVLRDAAGVLFTCEEERLLARQSFGLYRAKERVVAYGTGQPPQDAERLREVFFSAHPALRGKRIVLFLSRIHEKKGCDLLVRAFGQVAAQDPLLHLVVAGPDESGLTPGLQRMAQEAGVAERITWPGMLMGDVKWGAFYASEVFALPSHQENFGIAVAEALGCGLPVLISDKVNIWREIHESRSGLVGADTAAGFERLLRDWLALSGAGRNDFASQARSTFTGRFSVDAMASDLMAATQGLNAVVPLPGLPQFDPTS